MSDKMIKATRPFAIALIGILVAASAALVITMGIGWLG